MADRTSGWSPQRSLVSDQSPDHSKLPQGFRIRIRRTRALGPLHLTSRHSITV